MKKLIITLAAITVVATLSAQRQMESLDRGLVAIKTSKGVYASWRIPGEEWYDVTYNLYRDGQKVNSSPLAVSNFLDAAGTTASTYTVRALVNGVEQDACEAVNVWANQYLEIPLQPIKSAAGTDITSRFSTNDANAADLDGDGEMELIVKRMNTEYTSANTDAFTIFQAYKLDGTLLWTLNMGPNMINSGHVETNCMAFDFDEDGKAEVVSRVTDGSILPDGTVMGNAAVNYRASSYSANMAYQTAGDEFLVLLDGETGKLLDYKIFDSNANGGNNLARRSADYWGDGYGHRANKFHIGAPYLDGRRPSLYVGRGCYTNIHMATYDIVDKKLQLRWTYACDDNSSPFYGQGYHNFSVVDVDLDGRDEICHGNMVIDDDGSELSATGLGHGDAQHYGDLDPYRKGVEGFRCLEDNPGAVFVDAATNEQLIRWVRATDNGRCLAGNFTNNWPGAELWTTDGHLWSASLSRRDDQTVASSAPGVTMNFRIYWDGDILSESFDYVNNNGGNYGADGAVYKYGSSSPIFVTSGCATNNHSKGNPSLQADILGDWREEIIMRTKDDNALRIWVSTDLTEHRNYTLLHDPQYRQAVFWQMIAYNQPPHLSYFLGEMEGITLPPPPVVTNGKELVGTAVSSANDGQFLMLCETANTTVTASGAVKPLNMQVNSPADYVVKGGAFSGPMRLLKQGLGDLQLLEGTYNHSGNTEVWYGSLTSDIDLPNSALIVKRFAEVNTKANYGKGITMEHGAILRPAGAGEFGSITASVLSMAGGSVLELDMNDDGTAIDALTLDSLVLGATNPVGADPTIRIVRHGGAARVLPGDYPIVTVNKALVGDLSKVVVEGLVGVPYELKYANNQVILTIVTMRTAASILWTGAQGSVWNLNDVENFSLDTESTVFVTGDDVVFDASATNKTVEIADILAPGTVTINGDADYTFAGDGKISGNAALVKNGAGTLYINNENDFTGGARINEGVVSVTALSDAQNLGALGAYTSERGKLYIGGGATLLATKEITNATPIEVGEGGAIHNDKKFTQNAVIYGKTFRKSGSGVFQFGEYADIDKLEIYEGTVNVVDEYSASTCLGDTVVLYGGELVYPNSAYTYSSSKAVWCVPEGATAKISLDTRFDSRNPLVGGGTVTIHQPTSTSCPRVTVTGNWSKFTGKVNVTCIQSASNPFSLNNTHGLPNGTLNIPNKGDYVMLGGNNISTTGTYRIGCLTGYGTLAPGSSSSNIFEVGTLNKDFTFAGSSNAVLRKVGTGEMKMTGNTGTGTIYVSEGSLQVSGTSTTTTVSGTGLLTVQNGAELSGRGYMGNTKILVEEGGLFRPGYMYLGKLSVAGTVTIEAGGTIEFRINSNTTNSSITIGNVALFKGNIRIILKEDYVPQIGDTFTFWTAKTFNKSATPTLELPELPAGMMWDSSELCTKEGKLTIVADPNVALDKLEFTDAVEVAVFDLNGVEKARFSTTYGMVNATAAAIDMPAGIYMLQIAGEGQSQVKKFIKR